MGTTLLEVENLTTSFLTRSGLVRAVDGVGFSLERGQTLGIVGESGSGKSVTCYSLMRLLPMPPARIESGRALFGGRDLLACSQEELRRIRGREVGMVFQDPMTALNPYLRIGAQVMEPLYLHDWPGRTRALERAEQALVEVGIPDAAQRLEAYPHELSGGMRQRVVLAMALIAGPSLLIADEPTTALDVTVQAQILDLVKREQAAMGMAVVLISHDLGVVAGACERVMVMYAGRVVELGATREVFYQPKHPYTRALKRARPAGETKGRELLALPGQPPDPARLPAGCAFAPRCEYATDGCRLARPSLVQVESGHWSACSRVQAGEIRIDP